VKEKLVVGLFVLYGIVIGLAHHIDNQPGHQSNLYHFNYIVEIYILPELDLYFTNEGSPITGNELLYLRILLSAMFWGGIGTICYLGWWASKSLVSLKAR